MALITVILSSIFSPAMDGIFRKLHPSGTLPPLLWLA
jgi:hypothetical protein